MIASAMITAYVWFLNDLLIAVRDAGRRAIANPRDYEARASLMWAAAFHITITPAAPQAPVPGA